MKSNILNKEDRESVFRRIHALQKDAQPHWGIMNVNEMLVHCTDQIRMALGYINVPLKGNKLMRWLQKHIVFLSKKFPKGKIKTYSEVNPKKKGTKPTGFEDDKVNLIKMINFFVEKSNEAQLKPHPSFGKLNKEEWGRVIYIHLEHHLSQFEV